MTLRHAVDSFELLTHFFDAVNRFDMEAVAKCFDPEILRVEPEGFDTAGTYLGAESVLRHLEQGRGTWAEGSCNPEEFFSNGDRVVVYLHAQVRLKESGEWVGGRFADGFVVREGRIAEYRTFWERADALAWAGIEKAAG